MKKTLRMEVQSGGGHAAYICIALNVCIASARVMPPTAYLRVVSAQPFGSRSMAVVVQARGVVFLPRLAQHWAEGKYHGVASICQQRSGTGIV